MAWWRMAGWRMAVEADTTAVAGTGMQATIDGTAAGAGGEAVGTRGGSFRFQCLTLSVLRRVLRSRLWIWVWTGYGYGY